MPITDESRFQVHRSLLSFEPLLNCGIFKVSTLIIHVEGLSVIPYSIRDSCHHLTFQATLSLPINDDSRFQVHRSLLSFEPPLICGILKFLTYIIHVEGLSVIPYSIRDSRRLHVTSGPTVPLACRATPISICIDDTSPSDHPWPRLLPLLCY
uniref:Arrestin_C domain-containing protein n=1 Tax=Panagrellus redivivus TaxID=6233 RepID=A0A7E4UNZ7_PANRE